MMTMNEVHRLVDETVGHRPVTILDIIEALRERGYEVSYKDIHLSLMGLLRKRAVTKVDLEPGEVYYKPMSDKYKESLCEIADEIAKRMRDLPEDLREKDWLDLYLTLRLVRFQIGCMVSTPRPVEG